MVLVMTCSAFGQDQNNEDSTSGQLLQEIGLIQGDGHGLNEAGLITREAIVKMMVCMSTDLSADFELPETPSFSDVPADHWAYSWVERAYAADLTHGIGGGAFGLGLEVTQQQVSAFMMNLLNEDYSYATVIKEAMDKRGLKTEVASTFNRGNAFEMVAKTLAEVPLGQDQALYELSRNFEDKDVEGLIEKYALIEAEKNRLAEEALALKKLNDKKMKTYRSTWSNNKASYIEWVEDMEAILKPLWLEATVEDIIDQGHTNIRFVGLEDLTSSIEIRFNEDGSVILAEGTRSGVRILEKSRLLENVSVWTSSAYESYKMEGTHQGVTYTMVVTPDVNQNVYKGTLTVGSETFMPRPIGHDVKKKCHEAYEAFEGRMHKESFVNMDLGTFKSSVPESLKVDVTCREIYEFEGVLYSSPVGFDAFTFDFSQLNGAMNLPYVQEEEDLKCNLRIREISVNLKGDIVKIWGETLHHNYMIIYVKYDQEMTMTHVYINFENGSAGYIEN